MTTSDNSPTPMNPRLYVLILNNATGILFILLSLVSVYGLFVLIASLNETNSFILSFVGFTSLGVFSLWTLWSAGRHLSWPIAAHVDMVKVGQSTHLTVLQNHRKLLWLNIFVSQAAYWDAIDKRGSYFRFYGCRYTLTLDITKPDGGHSILRREGRLTRKWSTIISGVIEGCEVRATLFLEETEMSPSVELSRLPVYSSLDQSLVSERLYAAWGCHV